MSLGPHHERRETVLLSDTPLLCTKISAVPCLRFRFLAFLLCALPLVADAHPLSFTETTFTLHVDGTFQVDMVCDLDALALGLPQDTDDAQLVATLEAMAPDEFSALTQRLRQLFLRRIRVRFDGIPEPFEVAFPDHLTPRATESTIPTVLGLTARLTGSVPSNATELEFFASRSFSDVHLTVLDVARGTSVRSIMERGARSDSFTLRSRVASAGRDAVDWRYLRLGFVHIVPDGADHMLFVLGLFLLSVKLRSLVWQITAFTLAHAITLTLATANVVELSSRVVEPLIALSIVYVAIENTLTNRLNPWRPAVVFLFGLLHGLGFAGALTALGLPDTERILALVMFNLGIELGQLAVIGTALGTIGWWHLRPWYRRRIVIPLSVAIALVGVFWTLRRVLT